MSRVKQPTFKILLYRYKVLSNNQHPIMVRVTFNKKQKYYGLGLSTSIDAWDPDLSLIRRNGRRLTDGDKDVNLRLNKFSSDLERVRKYFHEVDFTFDRFETQMFPDNANSSVFTFMQSLIDQFMDSEKIGTAFSYRDSLNRVKQFRKDKDLTFRDIDFAFVESFKKHLRKTNSINSIGIYLRTLKATYNRAIAKGLIKSELSPFKGMRIETEPTRKRSLSREQVEALKKFKATPQSDQANSLNFFLFSYYCRGMNFGDLARLTWKDIRNDRIYYQRSKTKDPFDLPIDSKIAEILASYSGNDHFVFPILDEGLSPLTIKNRIKSRGKDVNSHLQDIAREINSKKIEADDRDLFPEDITFYWARHTFATVLKRSGVSTSLISEVLGHSSEKVTKTYLDSFEKDQLDQIGSLL